MGRCLFFILLCIATSGLTNIALSQSSKVTFYGKTKYKSIPTNAGKAFKIMQHCTTEMDSVISASQYHFENARMGKIKSCSLVYDMVDDLVDSITILLRDEKSRQQAIKQANKQFGNARFSENEMMSVYGWTHTTPQGEISISLAYSDRDPVSEMFIRKFE